MLKARGIRETSIATNVSLMDETRARALLEAGYRGAAAIDAWTYRAPDGELRLQALGEINARYSFGAVARAWADDLKEEEIIPWESTVRLCLGRGEIPGTSRFPLLLPGVDDPTLAPRSPRRRHRTPRP